MSLSRFLVFSNYQYSTARSIVGWCWLYWQKAWQG